MQRNTKLLILVIPSVYEVEYFPFCNILILFCYFENTLLLSFILTLSFKAVIYVW